MPQGCKGLWNLPCDFDPEGSDGEWIEIRESQHKCDVPPHAFTFDVVRRSTPSNGSSIGPQAMSILREVHTSEPHASAVDQALREMKEAAGEQADYTFLEEEDATSLINALEKSCHSTNEAIGGLRGAIKLRSRDPEDDDPQLYEDTADHAVHPLSGRPVQWEAQVKMLLLAGFPVKHPCVQGKLQGIREVLVKEDVRAKCPVPRSRHAFVVVDHTGILQPDQVFYQSSVRDIRTLSIYSDRR